MTLGRRCRNRCLLLGFAAVGQVLLAVDVPCLAQDGQDWVNIALGHECDFAPEPNWPYSVDPNNPNACHWALTDGVVLLKEPNDPNDPNYTPWYMNDRRTVGWAFVPRPIVIRIPVAGEDDPPRAIAGVRLHCGAMPENTVFWPFAAYILVSDDGVNYHDVGELVTLSRAENLSPPTSGYELWWFRTTTLQTHGKYVALVLSSFHSLFVDEVEVYEGDPNWLEVGLPGTAWQVESNGNIAPLRGQYWQWREPRFCVEKRWRDHYDTLLDLVNAKIPANQYSQEHTEALGRLAAAAQNITTVATSCYPNDPNDPNDPWHRMMYPIDLEPLDPNDPDDIHSNLFRVQALVWRTLGQPSLSVWQTGLWDHLSPFDEPPATPSPELDVFLLGNEARSACLNLTNSTDQPMTVTLRVEDLPGGTNPAYVKVHQIEWTDTKLDDLYETPSALIEVSADPDYTVLAHSGLHRQVWFTFRSLSLAPGVYQGTLRVTPSVGSQTTVPITLRVFPLTCPAQPSLAAMGWDHTNETGMYGLTPTNRGPIVARLREYLVDATMASANAMPPGEYDANGNMIATPSTSNFDAWVNLWQGARTYFVCLGPMFHGQQLPCADGAVFRAKIQAWCDFWAGHAISLGVDPSQIVLHIWDEPSTDDQADCTRLYAEAINGTNTGLRVMENHTFFREWHQQSQAIRDMLDTCDVLMPGRDDWILSPSDPNDPNDPIVAMRTYYQGRLAQGAELGLYDSMYAVMLLDPYKYYRLQGWSAIRHNLRYIGGWCYTHVGGATEYPWQTWQNSWNEYEMRYGNFSPLFIDLASADPSRHLMALRDGIQDYEYFVLLDQAIEWGDENGVPDLLLDYARTVRDRCHEVDSVKSSPYNQPYWRTYGSGDHDLADVVREQVADVTRMIYEIDSLGDSRAEPGSGGTPTRATAVVGRRTASTAIMPATVTFQDTSLAWPRPPAIGRLPYAGSSVSGSLR